MLLDDCLKKIVELKASDLHLKAGRPPLMRLRGDLLPMEGEEALQSGLYVLGGIMLFFVHVFTCPSAVPAITIPLYPLER